MKQKFSSLAVGLAVTISWPTATWASGTLTDLGGAAPAGLGNPSGNGTKKPYIVDVSRDGTVAAGTDSGGNAYIWTTSGGKVNIGSGYTVVAARWWTNGSPSAPAILVVANNWSTTPTRPWYWVDLADGTVETAWTQLPGGANSTSTAGYWFATGMGVTNDNSNWWVSGYTTNTTYNSTSPAHKQGVAYQYAAAFIPGGGSGNANYAQICNLSGTTNWNANGNSGHIEEGFYACSDTGWMVGTEQYDGGGAPGSGATHGCYITAWYDVSVKPRPHWLGPPESSGKPTTGFVSVSGAISADGTIKGGTDKNGAILLGLWWDNASPIPNVHKLPQLNINGTTLSDWMEVHSLNQDGTVIGGEYYRTDAGDVGYEAFVCFRKGTTIVSTNKLGDLLNAYGIATNNWVFSDVTALSNDGSVLSGWGTNTLDGLVHGWVAQTPAPVVQVTQIAVSGGTVTIDFTSNRVEDDTGFFNVQQAGTLADMGTVFTDASPVATITGSAGSFHATLSTTGDAQFYRIRRL